MFDLIINLGTKKFLAPYITKNSIFAYNIQYTEDYILINFHQSPQLAMTSCWQAQSLQLNPFLSKDFFLIYLNLNLDNQKLLFNQARQTQLDCNLYQRIDQRELLVFTKNPRILSTIAVLLHLQTNQLPAAIAHYCRVSKDS